MKCNKPTGKILWGRPRRVTTAADEVNEDIRIRVVDGTAKLEVAIDCDKWRNLEKAAKDLNG